MSRGADAIAAAYAARTPGYRTEAHPADWHRYGRAAGYRRNAETIALGADGCAAFVRGGSPGSTSAVQLARAYTRLASRPALTDSDSFLACLGSNTWSCSSAHAWLATTYCWCSPADSGVQASG